MGSYFDVYRYQINPIGRKQLRIFDKVLEFGELKARKNEFFFEALNDLLSKGDLEYRGHQITKRILRKKKNILIFQFAIDRGKVQVENPDFTEQIFKSYPNMIVGLNNDPTKQYVLIERSYKAFRYTHIASDFLEDNLNRALEDYRLYISINPIMEKNKFWEIIEKYPNIYRLKFEMTAPNLTNISGTIQDSIRNWFPETNSKEIDVEFNGSKESPLNLSKEVEPVASLAQYIGLGGGIANLRARDLDFSITTKDQAMRFHCDNLVINTDGTVDGLDEIEEKLGSRIENGTDEESNT